MEFVFCGKMAGKIRPENCQLVCFFFEGRVSEILGHLEAELFLHSEIRKRKKIYAIIHRLKCHVDHVISKTK